MYAIVATGGKQVRVSPGDVVRLEKLSAETLAKGDSLTLSDVLFVGSDKGFRTGKPYVDGVTVRATVLAPVKGRKVLIFKKKKRKQYRRTKGHRQQMLDVRIEAIEG